MIRTTRSDDIQDFLAFFVQMVGVEAATERAGAPLRDIERLARLARRPLPPLYLGYLTEYGRQDRVLGMADDGDARVAARGEFYAEQLDADDSEIPPNGVVISTPGLSGGRALLYQDGDASEPVVVENWWGEVGNTLASSFRNLLYSRAFLRGRFPLTVAHTVLERIAVHDLSPARNVATSLGFEPYWFADENQACMERIDGAALHLFRLEDRIALYLTAREGTVVARLKAALMQQLRLRDATPSPR
jgi:hypothetical protein